MTWGKLEDDVYSSWTYQHKFWSQICPNLPSNHQKSPNGTLPKYVSMWYVSTTRILYIRAVQSNVKGQLSRKCFERLLWFEHGFSPFMLMLKFECHCLVLRDGNLRWLGHKEGLMWGRNLAWQLRCPHQIWEFLKFVPGPGSWFQFLINVYPGR